MGLHECRLREGAVVAMRLGADGDGNVESWDRASARYQGEASLATDVASYGVGLPSEGQLRLIGSVKGKRVLDLGCGGGQASIAFARQGAHAIAIDASREQLAFAQRLAEREEVRVEFHEADLADLAFLPADSIDVGFCVFALAYVPDLGRVLRQVHRVLRQGSPFLFSYEHPMALCASTGAEGAGGAGAAAVTRAYFDPTPLQVDRYGEHFTLYPRTVSEVFVALARSGYRVDSLLEPEPLSGAPLVPPAIIWRARKEGH